MRSVPYDLRGAKRRHVRGPDSREGRFTLVAPGVGASTRNQWTGSVLSRTLLLLGVRGRFSPPRCTHRCRATVAMEVSVPASVARSLEPPFSDHRAASVVVALKPGGGSNGRVVVGISFAQFG